MALKRTTKINMKFQIPTPNNTTKTIEVGKSEKLVFLGANGTGKSKLGSFIEKSVFSQTQAGFEQNQNSLNQKKQELSLSEGKIEQLAQEISRFNSLSDERIIDLGMEYQQRKVVLPNNEIYTREQLLDLFLEGKIQVGNATFNGNKALGSFPPQSLKDIEGGTVEFGGIVFEIDLMKISKNKKETIEGAKKYFQTKNQVLLEGEVHKSDRLKREVKLLANKIGEFEECSFKFCQRISAHRSLVINQNIAPKDKEAAINELLFGQNTQTQNTDSKWRNNSIQNDFDKLLVALVSEEAELGAVFRQKNIKDDSIKTKLDYVIRIWNKLLPHRKISIEGLKISVFNEISPYQLSELSDGEKTIFYLLGQCLLTPKNSLIIIDEPDIHIHKAILGNLFDDIENLKSDCSFIYITHDIEFSNSRNGKKYALLNYTNPNKWEIEELINDEDIPESVLTSISGLRKPILFVEGIKKSSLDNIYNLVYQDFTVLQVNGCNEVKNYTKALNKNKRFHKVNCFGLIDKDGLDEPSIDKLNENNIFVLPVAIIENTLLLPEVAKHIYDIVGESNKFNETVYSNKVIEWIEYDENWKTIWIKEKLSSELQLKINNLPKKLNEFKMSEFEFNFTSSFKIHLEAIEEAEKKEDNKEKLLLLLQICRGKHVLPKLATHLGLSDKTSLENKILNNMNSEFIKTLRNILPKIE